MQDEVEAQHYTVGEAAYAYVIVIHRRHRRGDNDLLEDNHADFTRLLRPKSTRPQTGNKFNLALHQQP